MSDVKENKKNNDVIGEVVPGGETSVEAVSPEVVEVETEVEDLETPLTPQEKKIKEMRADKVSLREIAESLNISRDDVESVLAKIV